MDIGIAIAILGVWLFPAGMAVSSTGTSYGVLLSLVVASIFTAIFVTIGAIL